MFFQTEQVMLVQNEEKEGKNIEAGLSQLRCFLVDESLENENR